MVATVAFPYFELRVAQKDLGLIRTHTTKTLKAVQCRQEKAREIVKAGLVTAPSVPNVEVYTVHSGTKKPAEHRKR